MDFISVLGNVCATKLASAPTSRVSNYYQIQFYYPPFKRNQINYYSLYSKIYNEEGILGFWKVAPIDIVRQIVTNILNQRISSYLQRIPYLKDQTLHGLVLSALSLAAVYPMDVVRLNLSVDIGYKRFGGIIDCVSKIIQSKGVTGLYTGLLISIIGICVYRLTYSYLYRAMQRLQRMLSRVPTSFETLLLGYSVTLLAGILTYPLSVIRNSMVLQSAVPVNKTVYSGVCSSVSSIMKLEGFKGLYGGLSRHIFNSFLGFVTMIVYEKMKPQRRSWR